MQDFKWQLQVFDELPSTSTRCWQEAEAGAPAGLAILARHQTSGRGTKGRAWQTAQGNLSFSFLLKPGDVSRAVQRLPFLISVAVFDSIKSFVPEAELFLKWPNDILLAGAKLGGILIESDPRRNGFVVIGIGVNLASAPEISGRAAASLAPLGTIPTAEDLARRILNATSSLFKLLEAPDEKSIHALWLQRAHKVGTRLAVTTGGDYIEGTFVGLGSKGQLLLTTDDQRLRSFFAGETSLTVEGLNASRH